MNNLRRLLLPALIFALLFWALLHGPDFAIEAGFSSALGDRIFTLIEVLLWLVGALLLNRVLDVFVWNGLVSSALQRPPPRFLIQVCSVAVYLAAVAGILSFVFGQSVTAFWATSGVVGIILGIALQNLILDTFSGLAIYLERPFQVGDWINVHTRMGQFIGRVEETNWRTTRLWTTDRNVVIVPNSFMTTTIVVNYSLPENHARFELSFVMDPFVPSERVIRVLTAAVQSAIGNNGPLPEPAPKVRVNNISESGVEYKLRYYLDPAETTPSKARNAVLSSVLRHLRLSGLSLANPKQDLYVANMPWRQKEWEHGRDRVRQLMRISLFKGLEKSDLELLAGETKVHECRSGQQLVAQGDSGSSMFIVAEGIFRVSIQQQGRDLEVARLEPGDFFGEKSLLTGEPRSATVTCAFDGLVAEVTKEAVAKLLEASPDVAEVLSQAMARRDHRNEELREQQQLAAETTEINDRAGEILQRLKTFFRLA